MRRYFYQTISRQIWLIFFAAAAVVVLSLLPGGEAAAVTAIKNKAFFVSALGNPKDYGYTQMAFICSRDSDGAIVSFDWNTMGRGTISVSYGYTETGLYTALVQMTNCNVTGYTPYILIRTAELGLVPCGWNGLDMGVSGTNPPVGEVHNIPDAWYSLNSADSPGNPGYWVQMYIGAGFSWNHLQVQWRPARYTTTWDTSGATYTDPGIQGFLNSVVLECRSPGGTVPAQKLNGKNWFERKFAVTYNADGGVCEKKSQEVSSEFIGWNNQTLLGLGWDGYVWGSARNTTDITNCGYYANTYGDLMAAYGYQPWALLEHYLTYGSGEGRTLSLNHTWDNVVSADLYQPNVPFQNLTFVDGSSVTLRAVFCDSQIVLPKAVREGYEFVGWYQGGTYMGRAGDIVTVSSDMALRAKWEPLESPAEKYTYTIVFDGNGATGGRMEPVKNVTYLQELTLPENMFVNHAFSCTFQGWTLHAEDLYAAYGNGETLTVKELVDATGKIQENGAEIVLYAVWDQVPTIKAQNRSITVEQAEKGFLTQEELLRTAQADDREDGRLEKGEGKGFVVLDYRPEDFGDLGNKRWFTVTYRARDSVGNMAYETIRVNVTDERVEEKPDYIRFIDLENYKKENQKDGALYVNSIWYQNEEYAHKLKDALERIAAKTESGMVYRFSADEIKKSQEYVKQKGMGNSRSAAGLKNWLQIFTSFRRE